MNAPLAVFQLPRAKAPDTYDQRVAEQNYQAIERDLEQKFDRRGDLILDPGAELVLTADNSSAQYGLGIDNSGYLRVLDYSDGTIGTFSVAWAQVDGASQEITNLTAYVDAADATLQGSINTNAASIIVNGTAISGIETEITAARDGEVDLAAKFTSVEGAFASADSAIAASVTTLSASVYNEAQRPNLLAAEYQLFGEAEDLPFYIRRGAKAGTGVSNPFLNRDAQKFESDGTDPFLSVSLTSASATANVVAPPARYAYKISLRCQAANVTSIQVRMRDSANTLIASGTGHTPTGATQVIEGVIDLSSETVSDYFIDLHVTLDSSVSGVDFWVYRAQFEAIPDDATGPGDWSAGATTASVVETKEAVADIEGNLSARYAIAVDGGGGGTFFSLEDGTAIGSVINLSASEINLDGDAINLGSDTEFETTDNTFITETGGYRYRYGGPFGTSSDLLQWFGADSVAQDSETKTNGIFALATDGKVYYGSSELNTGGGTPLAATVSPTFVIGNAGGSGGTATTPSVTVTPAGGTSPYTHSWTVLQGEDASVTSPTAATTTFSATGMAANEFRDGLFMDTVTDDDGAIFQVLVRANFIAETVGP